MSEMQANQKNGTLASVLGRNTEKILGEWIRQMSGATRRSDLIKESDLRAECLRFLQLLKQAIESEGNNFQAPAYEPLRELLSEISRTRSQKGFKPSETATFVFSLKRPLFNEIQSQHRGNAEAMAAE